jgi:hypothetical protein
MYIHSPKHSLVRRVAVTDFSSLLTWYFTHSDLDCKILTTSCNIILSYSVTQYHQKHTQSAQTTLAGCVLKPRESVSPLPGVLRKRSFARGAGGVAEAEILKRLFVWRCPRYWRSERASEAADVQTVDAIKYFDIMALIAAVAPTASALPTRLLRSPTQET